jgi:hypothetical protein
MASDEPAVPTVANYRVAAVSLVQSFEGLHEPPYRGGLALTWR